MSGKHTPGPWHVGMKPGPIVYGPQGEQVANMHVAMLDQEEHKANARLIAAAPELLSFVRDYVEQADCGSGREHGSRDEGLIPEADCWHCQARALIAKAGGAK